MPIKNTEHNADRTRSLYLQSIRDILLESFSSGQKRIKQEEIYKICQRNQNILACKTPSFMYNGQWYAAVSKLPPPPEMRKWNRILSPLLLSEIVDLVAEDGFKEVQDKAVLHGFFTNVLTQAGNYSDLERLLPSSFMGQIPVIDRKVFDIAPMLPTETIETIKAENKEGIQLLNRMAMTDLLLQKRG